MCRIPLTGVFLRDSISFTLVYPFESGSPGQVLISLSDSWCPSMINMSVCFYWTRRCWGPGQPVPASPVHQRKPIHWPVVCSRACGPGGAFRVPQVELSPSQTQLEVLLQSVDLVMARHSQLQKQVLALYRQFLQAGKDKPGFVPRIREEFRVNARIKRTDVMHIEYLYRRGQRQLEQLKDINTKQLGSFSKADNQSWGSVTSDLSQHTSCESDSDISIQADWTGTYWCTCFLTLVSVVAHWKNVFAIRARWCN